MSSSTSTPAGLSSDTLSSDAGALAGICWRLVEAQHRVSTLKLVDSVDEQETLEDLIQASKPSVPPECQHLHYLLSTPFRYGAAYPIGSRFRRASEWGGHVIGHWWRLGSRELAARPTRTVRPPGAGSGPHF